MDNPINIELNADTGGSEQTRSRMTAKQAAQHLSSKSTGSKGGDAASSRNRADKLVKAKSNNRGQGKTKKEQLIALLSKPNGARVSVIVERLGWQGHTVRAALSGLRKQGFPVVASKSAKTGETSA
jgi:Protein of unknown function (DUF3489)